MGLLIGIGLALLVIVLVLTHIIVFIWCELKIFAHIMDRYGPIETGKFHGVLQPFADVLKLMNKEDTVPGASDRLIFKVAPFVVFVPAFMAIGAIPLSATLVVINLDIGAFYIIALSAFTFVGMIMAGWSSFNKYSLLGAFRAAGQLLSYELPFGLTIAGVAMMASSLNLITIVNKQVVPNAFIQPIGFLVFVIAAEAELSRSPFDIPHAESEIIAGYHIEYSGMRWALFYLAEYVSLIILCSMTALLFLGGFKGPILPPPVWFLLKVYVLFFILAWIRITFPRVRPDQLMDLGWKVLLPASLLNIVLTASIIILLPDIWPVALAVTEFTIVIATLIYLGRTRR